MINAERIARLTDQVEQLEQMLLDTNPDQDIFWQITSVKDHKVAEIETLRKA